MSLEVRSPHFEPLQQLNGEAHAASFKPAQSSLQELFEKVRATPHRTGICHFLRQAREIQPDLKEYERFLNALEAAVIISSKEKVKQLFLHACSLLLQDEAQKYLIQGKFDSRKLLIDLLAAENTPSMAFQLVCRKHADLDQELATIPTLMRLIREEVDVNLIVIEGLHPVEWIIKHNEGMLRELLIYSSRLSSSLLKSEIVKGYFAKTLSCPVSNVGCVQIISALKELGASIIDGNEALFTQACIEDDEKLAQSLLDDGLEPTAQFEEAPLLLFACQKPNANKVAELLLSKNLDPNVFHKGTKQTPLHAALKNGNVAMCLVLMQYGADLFAEDCAKETPFQLILRSDDSQIRLLVHQPDNFVRPWNLKVLVQNLKTLHQKSAPSEELKSFLSILITTKFDQAALNSDDGIELFCELIRFKAYDAIEAALRNGFSLYRSKEKLITHFTVKFLSANLEPFIYLLKWNYLDPNAKTSDETPLVFTALLDPTMESLRQALQDKKVRLNTTTKEGDTLLHFYCKNATNGNHAIPSIQNILGEGIAVNALDIHKRPALYYALHPLKPEIVELLITSGAHPFHLSDRLMSYLAFVQQDRVSLLFKDFKMCQGQTATYPAFCRAVMQNGARFPEELLEINFLLPAAQFTPLAYFRSKERYLEALLALHKKYPDAPQEYFYPFLLQLNLEHLQRKALDFKIPEIKSHIPVMHLLQKFDGLNWHDRTAPNYCDPAKVRIAKHEHRRDTLRRAFQTLLAEYVPHKMAFTGTPVAGTQDLVIFYNNLENLLKHIVLLLEKEQDQNKITKCVLKLAWSALYCGTRWEETALRLYTKLKYQKSKETLLEDKFDEQLALIREQIVSDLNRGNIHGHRFYLKSIGDKYNIPLSAGVPKVNETHQPVDLTPEICEQKFCATYNASQIMPSTRTFFEVSIKKADAVLVRWFKNNMPRDYTFPGFKELSWQAKSLELLYKEPQQHRAAVQRLFRDNAYPVRSDFTSVDDLLKGIHQEEYRERMVYNDELNKIFDDGIIHFLQTRGVLSEAFKGIYKDFISNWQQK